MKDPLHLAAFLGKRIAIQDGPNRYKLLILYGILANETAIVGTSKGDMLLVDWATLENSYMIVDRADIEVEYK